MNRGLPDLSFNQYQKEKFLILNYDAYIWWVAITQKINAFGSMKRYRSYMKRPVSAGKLENSDLHQLTTHIKSCRLCINVHWKKLIIIEDSDHHRAWLLVPSLLELWVKLSRSKSRIPNKAPRIREHIITRCISVIGFAISVWAPLAWARRTLQIRVVTAASRYLAPAGEYWTCYFVVTSVCFATRHEW